MTIEAFAELLFSIDPNAARNDSGDVITPEWIMKRSFPSDLKGMSDAFIEAINKGMKVETAQQETEVDEVLADIQKNGQGAAGT